MDLTAELARALDESRGRFLALIEPFDEAVLRRQHDKLMSPLLWDLAHVANYEDIWLVRALGEPPTREGIDQLYDAFEQPRGVREELAILSLDEALSYAASVRARALELLERSEVGPDAPDPLLRNGFVHSMVAQHEHQHAETVLAAIQLLPVDEGHRLDAARPPALGSPPSSSEVFVPGGPFTMGSDDPWVLDNERPAHEVEVRPFWIDTVPVTNERYAAFVDAGGYDDPRWWSDAGWAWRQEASLEAPQFWRRDGVEWLRVRFGQLEPVPGQEPVQHVCWYEADAWARWAGRRLPTEPEWEKAARHDAATESSRGDVWEWLASDFRPYPGFDAFPYKEYSQVFFGDGYKMLRGGSWATHPSVGRVTFRNWDLPVRRQIFAGFRTARDA